MQVLVDTSVWSLAMRRPASKKSTGSSSLPAQHPAIAVLRDLIADSRACMIGAVRQELLSGIKTAAQFKQLSSMLAAFEDIAIERSDYELAAEFFNSCRSKGVQGASTDFLICAVASSRGLPILTTDQDFLNYKKYLPIQLL